MGFSKNFDNFRVREPFRDVLARFQPRAEFGSGDVESANSLGHLIVGFIFVGVGQVDHLLEGHDLDAELVFVFLHGVLGVIGAIEVFTRGVFPRAGVVSSDNKVGCAMVLADYGVPDGFSGAAHTHC